MKKVKKALSLCMVMVLLLSSSAFVSSAETRYDKYGYCHIVTDLTYSRIGVKLDDLKYETVDGARFVYFVKDGEATILNVRTNYVGNQKNCVFVFPTHLGGYPVTTIGDMEHWLAVFDYFQFPGDVEPDNFEDRAETDPGIDCFSTIVIPEGYKYIGMGAFTLVTGTFLLPDSVEMYRGDEPFEDDGSEIIEKPWPNTILSIKPATDTPYFAYGNRDYKLELTGSPSKIQLIRENGTTTTIDRSKATITSNGETETWVVNMRVGEGEHAVRAKYGKVWDKASVPFAVTYDTPKAHSFDITYENGIGTFEVVTDPQIAKVQFLLDSGSTLTYSQSYSHIAEDGMRHWTVIRKIPADTNYTLKTKLGYTWTTTDLKVTS